MAGPFSFGEGIFILPITPTPLDKFPAQHHGRRGLWSGTKRQQRTNKQSQQHTR